MAADGLTLTSAGSYQATYTNLYICSADLLTVRNQSGFVGGISTRGSYDNAAVDRLFYGGSEEASPVITVTAGNDVITLFVNMVAAQGLACDDLFVAPTNSAALV